MNTFFTMVEIRLVLCPNAIVFVEKIHKIQKFAEELIGIEWILISVTKVLISLNEPIIVYNQLNRNTAQVCAL